MYLYVYIYTHHIAFKHGNGQRNIFHFGYMGDFHKETFIWFGDLQAMFDYRRVYTMIAPIYVSECIVAHPTTIDSTIAGSAELAYATGVLLSFNEIAYSIHKL